MEIFYDLADINLDVDIAIPLGLIINELVTNSVKYAFPKAGKERSRLFCTEKVVRYYWS